MTRLTDEEIAYTRRVAAQIGRYPDDLIREGQQLNAEAAVEATARQAQGRQRDMETLSGRHLGSGARAYHDPRFGQRAVAFRRSPECTVWTSDARSG